MLDPKPHFNFHVSITEVITTWKRDPSFKEAILAYGLKPYPWAELRYGNIPYLIPLPLKPNPYTDWNEWFKDYLEDQVALISKETKAAIYVIGNKGNKFELCRKESVEEFVEDITNEF